MLRNVTPWYATNVVSVKWHTPSLQLHACASFTAARGTETLPETHSSQTDNQMDRQVFPDSVLQVEFGELMTPFCKQQHLALLSQLTKMRNGCTPLYLRTKSRIKQTAGMYSELAKKTDHFNSGHDGLVDNITVR